MEINMCLVVISKNPKSFKSRDKWKYELKVMKQVARVNGNSLWKINYLNIVERLIMQLWQCSSNLPDYRIWHLLQMKAIRHKIQIIFYAQARATLILMLHITRSRQIQPTGTWKDRRNYSKWAGSKIANQLSSFMSKMLKNFFFVSTSSKWKLSPYETHILYRLLQTVPTQARYGIQRYFRRCLWAPATNMSN